MVTYEDNGFRYYWDPNLQLWTIYRIDPDGRQVGDADYEPNREKLTLNYPELEFNRVSG